MNIATTEKKSPIIVALDFSTLDSAEAMAELLDPTQCRVKVGKELFTSSGPAVVEALQKKGFDVFLDLKFHDIPNTTSKAVAVAADLGVWMVNVHASGGRKMMEACADILAGYQQKPLLTAVTVLTSLDHGDMREVGLDCEPIQQVERLALLTQQSGLDGVVCSSREVTRLRKLCGAEFSLVTPGIRPVNASLDDQNRVMTPEEAMAAGASYLVIGRPVTQAKDPQHVLRSIINSIS